MHDEVDRLDGQARAAEAADNPETAKEFRKKADAKLREVINMKENPR